MTDSRLYKSLTLPNKSRDIRLLEVSPKSTSEEHEPITGRLFVVDLDEHPSYSALSYVCGNDASSHTITCETFTVVISQNCYTALLYLQKKLRKLTIWIDAISIHQADEDEKAYQIQLMGHIYSQAETVYVWLGTGNARSDRAISYLARAGLLEYYFPDAQSDRPPKPQKWAAVWSLLVSAKRDIAKHHIPVNGK